jgi:hypothetical protein
VKKKLSKRKIPGNKMKWSAYFDIVNSEQLMVPFYISPRAGQCLGQSHGLLQEVLSTRLLVATSQL